MLVAQLSINNSKFGRLKEVVNFGRLSELSLHIVDNKNSKD